MKKINTEYKLILTVAILLVLPLSGCNRSSIAELPNQLVPWAVSENNGSVEEKKMQTATVSTVQYENFYKETKEVPDIGKLRGGIVPHHLVAGYMPATFFNYLREQKPSVIILLGPNHFEKGRSAVIASARDWQTPFGVVQADSGIIQSLANKQVLAIEEESVVGEHSLANIMPFIAKSLPKTKVVPIMLYYKTRTEKLDELLGELLPLFPKDAVIISSIDFSHYQTEAVGNFHDELSKGVIKNFDYTRLDKLEIDSTPSLYVLLKSMEYFGAKKIGFELSDSAANIAQAPELPSGTSYYSPYFVEGGIQTEKIASILNFGDMMLDRNVRSMIDKNSKDYLFEKLAGEEKRFFIGMDAVSANLEGPFADKRRATTKSIAFRFNPDLLPMLKKYNFSLFSQANNHTYDMSAAGFEESKKNLAKAGFDFYGAQYKIDDSSLLVKKIGDFTFGFIGINDTNSPVDTNKVIDLIKKAKRGTLVNVRTGDPTGARIDSLPAEYVNKADFVIINAHWGAEYKEISNDHQRQLAHALIDVGADVIIGHHPHVIQEMEIYKNHPIFYSLGNFIFDQYFSVPTQQGLGVGLVFKENCHCEECNDEAISGSNKKCLQKEISISIFPLQGVKSQVTQMTPAKGRNYLNGWLKNSRIGEYKFNNFNLKINI